MKAIVIVADGMADRPLKQLGGKTPLEAANKPALDEIARRGECGIVDMISPGVPPGSDVANMSILGYDPRKYYRGRGALEALGIGLEVGRGEIAFRGNFATVDEKGIIIDRRAGRIDGKIFEETLADIRLKSRPEVRVLAKPSVEHRIALVIGGSGLSWNVSDSDPLVSDVPPRKIEPLDGTSEAFRTAEIVNEILQILKERLAISPINSERLSKGLHPANAVLLRSAGTPPDLRPIDDVYKVKGLCVAVNPVVRGICRSAGLDIPDVPGATGGVDTDTLAKAKVVERNIERYDFVYLHVKGTDSASHDGKTEDKIRMIEKVDAMARHLLDNVDMDETYIAVTADHTTSLRHLDHVGDPVPLAIAGPEVRTDSVQAYSERTCARGGLGRIRGLDIMPIIMNYLGKMNLYGS